MDVEGPHGQGTARENVLRAAIDLIARHGADRLTHRMAAEAAGVSPGTVTYHFETREDLIRQAFGLYIEDYEIGLEGALDARPLTSLEDVTRFLATLTTLSPDAAELARIEYEMITHAQRDDGLRDDVAGWAGLLPARISAVLEGQGIGDARAAAELLIAICRGTEIDVLTRGVEVSPEAFQARLLSVLESPL